MTKSQGFLGKGMIAALVVIAAAAGSASYMASSLQQQAEKDLVERTVSNVFSNMAVVDSLDGVYLDENGDLVADRPEQASLTANPTELKFSFIPSGSPTDAADVWEAATKAISEKTGLPVSYLKLDDSREQLAALRAGQLHITAFSSGSVPTAVNQAGFVPVCTIGTPAEGEAAPEFGYNMQFIVKADSKLKDLNQLRGKKIAFVRPGSNSGCKAAMIQLWEEHEMQPQRDYDWYYTYSHEASVDAILSGKADAAPTASDILARMQAKGEVEPDSYRVIYESERFPPVAFGCAHNLTSELQDAIKLAMAELDWSGTKLAEEMSAGESKKFLPVSYKDDWANIRRVDKAAAAVSESL